MNNDKNIANIVTIGGGTGLSCLLRGLKKYSSNLSAIVTMADDGGGSGRLRNELSMPPPGDVRHCLEALANTEPTMEKLLSYRFQEGSLKGQNLGNLFLAALSDIYGSFFGGVEKLSEVLAITGRVLPVTTQDVRLLAEFDDGAQVLGESKIRDFKIAGDRVIKCVRLIPELPEALHESLEAIEMADLIVLGPGSLYTSIIPNLLTKGIVDAIKNSDALKLYVLNVATEDGETENFTASDHVRAIFKHANCDNLFDYCIANETEFPAYVRENHKKVGASQTMVDKQELERLGVRPLCFDLLNYDDGFGHHDSMKLAKAIMEVFKEKSPTRIYG